MTLLDGKAAAQEVKDYLKKIVDLGVHRKLVIVQVGDNPASNTYIKNKVKACEYVGVECEVKHFEESITEEKLLDEIDVLNDANSVDGIIVQLPLPEHIVEGRVTNGIKPIKDVDGFTNINAGRLMHGGCLFFPATPLGIATLLEKYNIETDGKECVIVGRSNIVGKPMALLMLDKNATVTITHSYTKNLKEVCKRADILIVAIGKPKMINREYIKEGAVVIDVGINQDENGKLCGDVDFDDVKEIVSAITPVPGGVGPMTVAMLLNNVVGGRK